MPQRVTLTTRKALDLTVAGPPSDCASNCPKIGLGVLRLPSQQWARIVPNS